MNLTTEVKNKVVVFHDGSREHITSEQEKAIFQMTGGVVKGIKINGNYYAFSGISKILNIEDFYIQYPDERPEYTPDTFQEQYGAYTRQGSEQVRQPTGKAKELMIQGIKKAFCEMGKSEEDAGKCLEKFTKKQYANHK